MTARVLITGAAGNLGGLLARHLAKTGTLLRLMQHVTPVAADLVSLPNVEVATADLAEPATLVAALQGVEVVVHFAGVLFKPRPERFLPVTNTRWFENLVDAAAEAGVKRVVLISFPHVEGPTTPAHPAQGRLDGTPRSAHATTRLAEERRLLAKAEESGMTPVILRLGMVYGHGILMVDTARWLAEHHLLAVWREPTPIHLVSIADYLAATAAAITMPTARGIYHVGDDGPLTLQEFLDRACEVWGVRRPWRFPLWLIYTAGAVCELFATLFGTRAPLTRDFITIGRVSYWGDTGRTRRELQPTMQHATLSDGIDTLR